MKSGVGTIWCYQLLQHGVIIAYGERHSEQGAIEAVRLAERRYGLTLSLKQ